MGPADSATGGSAPACGAAIGDVGAEVIEPLAAWRRAENPRNCSVVLRRPPSWSAICSSVGGGEVMMECGESVTQSVNQNILSDSCRNSKSDNGGGLGYVGGNSLVCNTL